MAPPPPGNSWRGGAKSQPAAGPTRPKAAGWSAKPDRDYQRSVLRYRLKVGLWSLLFFSLVVTLFVILIYWPVRTPFLVLAVTDYDSPLPPNAWVREDLQRLSALADATHLRNEKRIIAYSEVPWESVEQVEKQLQKKVAEAEDSPGGPNKDLVLIYVSMHGAVNDKGEPCLIPPGASPQTGKDWLRLGDLLSRLFKERADGRHDKIKKLLILDCNRMDANWQLGLLYNGFADGLTAMVEKLDIPNLYVLNSTSPGQIGWSAPELGGSVFGYFLAQGIEGAADVESENPNGRVSLTKLTKYLERHVSQWVTENRADWQEPMLLGPKADCQVVFARSTAGTVLPPPESDRESWDKQSWDKIAGLWNLHAKVRGGQPYRRNPLEWEIFQSKLLRLEQLAQSGDGYKTELETALQEAEGLGATLARGPKSEGALPAYSLSLAQQWRKQPPDTDHLPVPWKAAAAAPGSGPKPAENPAPAAKGSAAEKTADKPAAQPAEKPAQPQRYDYFDAAAAAWRHCLDRGPSHQELAGILGFVDGAEGKPKADVVEIHFLRMLNAYLDDEVWKASPEQVRQALLARQLAEQAAAPADVRTRDWVQAMVDRADAQRRSAEDKLFVGLAAEPGAAEGIWNRLNGEDGKGGDYRQAIDRATEVAVAFEIRDRALSETPYLAGWLLSRLHSGEPSQQRIHDLIENNRRLAKALEESRQSGSWNSETAGMTRRVKAGLAELEKSYEHEWSDLLTAGPDKHALRRIFSVLSVPLVTGEDRNLLRTRALSIATSLRQQGFDVAERPDPAAPAESADSAGRWLDLLGDWQEHPALAIVGHTTADGKPGPGLSATAGTQQKSTAEKSAPPSLGLVRRLADEGDKLRVQLAGLPDEVKQGCSKTAELLAKTPPELLTAVRLPCSRAEQQLRAAAPLLCKVLVKEIQVDPVAELGKLDLRGLLLWQARRTLEDFWGPRPGSETPPFFDLVAGDYLDAAKGLGRDVSDLPENAMRQRLATAVKPLQPVLDRPTVYVTDAAVDLKHRFSVKMAGGLPPGEAAAYVENADGLVPRLTLDKKTSFRRIPVPVDGRDKPEPFSVPDYWITKQRWTGAGEFFAVALYRGHVQRQPFELITAEGIAIEHKQPRESPTRITVYGQSRQKMAIEFILDCSGSMTTPVPGTNNKPRIDVAREVLEEVLTRLAAPGDACRAAVRVYGHRVGVWDRKIWVHDPKQRGKYQDVPPAANLPDPNDDQELLQDFDVLTERKLHEITEKLEDLQPIGITPLYSSILEAIKDLRNDRRSQEKRIIVLTDGVDEQITAAESQVQNANVQIKGGNPKFASQVDDALSNNPNIRLDVVGFAIEPSKLAPGELAEYQKMNALMEGLKRHGRGQFYSVDDQEKLLSALRGSLAMNQYSVRREGSTVTTYKPLDLNKPCQLREPVPGRYRITVADAEQAATAEVDIDGGEWPALYFLENPRQLVHHRYERELRDSDHLPLPEDPAQTVFIGAHEPKRHPGAVDFFVSVQNGAAEKFSRRPREAWIEIRPLPVPSQPGALKSYVFYDMEFEPECPVPVLRCHAPRWPEASHQAEIRLWCKFQETPPGEKVKVGSFRQPRLADAADVEFDLETTPNSRPDEPYQVIVSEHYPAGGDLHSVKIDVQPAASHVKRLYTPAAGVVRHTFFYEGNPSGQEVENFVVRLVAKKKLVEDAVVSKPLRVTIPD